MRRLLAFAVIAWLAVGCASTGKLQAPHLSLVGANMTSADVFSQQFRVRIHVDNPNARALPVKRLEYEVYLEGDHFADGTSEVPFVVPANGQVEFDLGLQTHFMSSIGRLLAHLTGTDRQDIEYVVKGAVVLDMGFSPKLKFSEGGTVRLGQR